MELDFKNYRQYKVRNESDDLRILLCYIHSWVLPCLSKQLFLLYSCFLLSGELLSSGERREVEIRGCSIWCVEKIKDHLWRLVRERDRKSCDINSALIDFYLWPYAKQHHEEMAHIPIHHTRCIYY